MPRITVLPHPEYCPAGTDFDEPSGTTLCDALLDHGIDIEHACGKVGACTTCHIFVSQGFASLNAMEDQEEDMLDRAWGLRPDSRLSCQARVGQADLVVDVPRYSVNQVKENG